MSETSDTPDNDMPESEALAAEYALGVLDLTDRARAAARTVREPAFARRVAEWEARLDGLNDGIAEERVPRVVKTAIDARLFGGADVPGQTSVVVGILQSLAFWRGAAVAAAAALAIVVFQPTTVPVAPVTLVLDFDSSGSDAAFLAVYDPGRGGLRVTQTSGAQSDGDFEMWVFDASGVPVSLGLVGGADPLSADAISALGDGATVAVSREPAGGSPTGQPTGDVVAIGTARTL